jgi:GxxExxY protein
MDTDECRHKALTERIIQAAFTVHNTLGSGFLEKVYENAMVIELGKAGLNIVQQAPLQVTYNGSIVGEYYADLVVDNKILLELKAVSHILPVHEVQLVNYLKATETEVGLLINFANKRVEVRRKIQSRSYSRNR